VNSRFSASRPNLLLHAICASRRRRSKERVCTSNNADSLRLEPLSRLSEGDFLVHRQASHKRHKKIAGLALRDWLCS